ncbi:hypothetical protein BX616_010272 [Lobosporangium transversale]|nr:hypothetical protein BX616_010272 [Lobosporangium transversale]
MNNEIEDQCKVKGGEDAQGNIHSTAFSRLHLSPSKFAPPLPAQVSSFEPLVLTNLKVLRCLSFPCDLLSTGHNNEYLYQILTFVEACPHLHTFELDHFVYESHFIIRLSKVLCHHSSLKDFSLLPAKAIHLRDLQILLRHCNRLESLEVACYPYCPTTSSEEEMKELEEMPETTIRHLNFARVVSSGLIPTLVAFLKKCPQLIELRFLDHNESQLLMETITNYLPKLCRLDFSRTTIQIARVINACQTGIESFKDICLASCSAVQGRDIQAILVSCPNLVSFHGMPLLARNDFFINDESPILSVIDMKEEAKTRAKDKAKSTVNNNRSFSATVDWVCLRLRELTLRFEETEMEVFPKLITDQICALKQLEYLRLLVEPQRVSNKSTDSAPTPIYAPIVEGTMEPEPSTLLDLDFRTAFEKQVLQSLPLLKLVTYDYDVGESSRESTNNQYSIPNFAKSNKITPT